jgi:hypothetical protein
MKTMTVAKQFLDAIKVAGGLRTAKVGSKLFVYDSTKEVDVETQMRAMAIQSGHGIQWRGQTESYHWIPVEHHGLVGSDRYEWHKDGQRIRQRLVLRVVKDGKVVSTQSVRCAWRNYLC